MAEEERDTCPSCGLLRVVCRDPENQFAFEPHEEECFPTKRLAQHRESAAWANKHDVTKAATQVSAQFRDGHEAPIDAGLDLGDVDGDESPVAGVA